METYLVVTVGWQIVFLSLCKMSYLVREDVISSSSPLQSEDRLVQLAFIITDVSTRGVFNLVFSSNVIANIDALKMSYSSTVFLV